MKVGAYYLAALCLTMAVVSENAYAKQVSTYVNDRKVRAHHKMVEVDADSTKCNNNIYCPLTHPNITWCFVPQTPMLKAGWETD